MVAVSNWLLYVLIFQGGNTSVFQQDFTDSDKHREIPVESYHFKNHSFWKAV